MKTLWIPFVLAVLLAVAPSGAGATTPGAEWNISASLNAASFFGGAGFSALRAQTFEAVRGGRVESIALRIARASDHEVPLRLSLFAVGQDGHPAGDALLSRDFSPAGIGVMQMDAVSFAFDAGESALLAAGQSYAIVMSAAEPGTESLFYVGGGFGAEATYEGGVALRSSDGQDWFGDDLDLAFQVLVDESVPVQAVSWGRVKRLF